MEGLLSDPDKGWRVLYTDSENDVMVVGDDQWHEFCNVVSKIHIYTQEAEKISVLLLVLLNPEAMYQVLVVFKAKR
ncbi:hypothetical protein HRI_002900100 [Hibiscus trionum]|uniref:Auxin-responsive protein n=1 Tax=Hibiscus trionum TaxID=183268 RepID=A0A9W7IBB7_HIBTR|nr:hypothetical protein HRI_002900100 [Hibiscus trionum]